MKDWLTTSAIIIAMLAGISTLIKNTLDITDRKKKKKRKKKRK